MEIGPQRGAANLRLIFLDVGRQAICFGQGCRNRTAIYEETNDPRYADRRNFYKVEKWSRDGRRIEEMVFAGNSLAKAQRFFESFIKRRPRVRLTIRQRARVSQEWPPAAAECFTKEVAMR